MLRNNLPVKPGDDEPALDWERSLWHWHVRFLHCRAYNATGEAVALDRAPWWHVIDREGWCHRQAMYLLQRLEDALFNPIPADDDSADYKDWD